MFHGGLGRCFFRGGKWEITLSNDKKVTAPGSFGYRGDEMLPSYVGIIS